MASFASTKPAQASVLKQAKLAAPLRVRRTALSCNAYAFGGQIADNRLAKQIARCINVDR